MAKGRALFQQISPRTAAKRLTEARFQEWRDAQERMAYALSVVSEFARPSAPPGVGHIRSWLLSSTAIVRP